MIIGTLEKTTIAKATGTSKKQYVYSVVSKLTTLHMHYAFLQISLSLLHMNGQIVCSLENGNKKTINSTISF